MRPRSPRAWLHSERVATFGARRYPEQCSHRRADGGTGEDTLPADEMAGRDQRWRGGAILRCVHALRERGYIRGARPHSERAATFEARRCPEQCSHRRADGGTGEDTLPPPKWREEANA